MEKITRNKKRFLSPKKQEQAVSQTHQDKGKSGKKIINQNETPTSEEKFRKRVEYVLCLEASNLTTEQQSSFDYVDFRDFGPPGRGQRSKERQKNASGLTLDNREHSNKTHDLRKRSEQLLKHISNLEHSNLNLIVKIERYEKQIKKDQKIRKLQMEFQTYSIKKRKIKIR